MDVYSIIWLVWAAVMATTFGIVEGITLHAKNHGYDTLSDNIQRLFHTHSTKGRVSWLVVFGGFAVWFLVHIGVPGSLG